MRTIAFWLSLGLVFTIPWEAVVEYPALGSVTRLIGFAVAAFWVLTVAVTDRIRKPAPFQLAVSLFVVWNAISVMWSANADRTTEHLVTWAQLLILTFIVWDLYTTRAALMAGLQMYILGAYVALGNTLVNFFSGRTFYYERFSAAGTNPDDLGSVLALGISVAWYLAASKRTQKWPQLLKWVNYAYIPAALMGIALSGTRTALIAAIPGVVFGLTSLSRLRLSVRVAIFLLLILAVVNLLPLIPQASLQRLGTTGNELTSGDLNGRVHLWTQGLVSFVERPLLGIGSNMYRSVNTEGKVAHNSFISVLVELGLIGLILFGIILAMVVIQAWHQPRWDRLFWLSILAAWAVAASTLTWEYRKPTWLFLSFVIASSALASQRAEGVQLVRRNEPDVQFNREPRLSNHPDEQEQRSLA